MYQLLVVLASLTTITISSALQLPLINTAANVDSQAPSTTTNGRKALANDGSLESLITKEKLLKRANDLYDIAKLSIDEYGHPTRVIGSKGKQASSFHFGSS